MPTRPTNPLDRPMRPPTPAEVSTLRPTTEEIDRLLADTAKAWAVPTAQWRRIAKALNARPGKP